jgi:hypothetical protein
VTEHPGLITPLSPMLYVCLEEGCSAIVFGQGTCTEHDRKPPADLSDTLLSRAADATHPSGSSQPPEMAP